MKTTACFLAIVTGFTGFLLAQSGDEPLDSKGKDPTIGPIMPRERNSRIQSSFEEGKKEHAVQSSPVVPAEALEFVQSAREQFDSGDYRGAEKTYDKALAQAPKNAFLLANKAVVLYREQKYQLAEEACQQAVALAPQDDFNHCLLGIVEYQIGKFDAAINAMTKVLAIDPQNATAHHYLGILATHKGWTEAALKEFQTARTLIPNQVGSHLRQP